MPVVPLQAESRVRDGFYVPTFEVKIEGAGLPRDVLRDVTSVTYKDDINAIDSFELTVNNWDASINQLKYVGAETAASLRGEGPYAQRHRLFDPCYKVVTLRMGYVGELRTMLTGNFTTLEPSFPSGGGPTLSVRGLNVLHQLRRKQHTTVWTHKRDSEIALDLDGRVDRETGRRRFPLPIEVDPAARAQEQPQVYVAQQNQYDIDFLFSRARQRGYVLFVQEADPHVRGSRRRLYFGPSHEGMIPGLRDVTFLLHWGRTLMEFKPTLTTANQVRSVTVNGWNRTTRRAISETVTLDDRRFSLNRDLYEDLQRCDPREEVVVEQPVRSEAEARELAFAILSNRVKDRVKCTGTTVGLPDLRAGQRVRIEGVGARFSGTYFVTDTTHTLNGSGYLTRFSARREDEGAA